MFMRGSRSQRTAARRPRPERSALYINSARGNANRQGSRAGVGWTAPWAQTHALPMADDVELVVAGGGLVGMLLGLACAGAGLEVAVIDRQNPAAMLDERFDGRTSAIAYGSPPLFAGARRGAGNTPP